MLCRVASVDLSPDHSALYCRQSRRAQEGDLGNAADGVKDVPVAVDDECVCLLRPADCHLLQQPQAGLLKRQPEGGQLHVSTALRGLPQQVTRPILLSLHPLLISFV